MFVRGSLTPSFFFNRGETLPLVKLYTGPRVLEAFGEMAAQTLEPATMTPKKPQGLLLGVSLPFVYRLAEAPKKVGDYTHGACHFTLQPIAMKCRGLPASILKSKESIRRFLRYRFCDVKYPLHTNFWRLNTL